MKNQSSPRFEVDFKTRLKQQCEATNAVRLPRLGYQEYRVYDIEEPKDKVARNGWYGVNGQQIGRVIRNSPINIVTSSYNSGKSTFWIIDKWSAPSYKVKWLKPKQATLLRLKGHRVEEI
jgi:hypothetical protein